MTQSWREKTLQYCFYSMMLLALLLPITETGTDIAYALAAAFALFSGVVWLRKDELYRHPINCYLLILLLMMVLGLTYSIGLAQKSTWLLLKQYLWILFTPWLLLAIQTTEQRQKLLNTFLWSNVIILVLSYAKVFGVLHLTNTMPAVVFRGHIGQNFFMSFASSLWLYFAFTQPKYRQLMLVLFAVSSINVFLTISRTGYLNWAILIFFVLYRQLSWKYLILASLAGVVFIAALFSLSSTFQQRTESALHEAQQYMQNDTEHLTSIGTRGVQIASGWELTKQRPWLGFGTGSLGQAYASLPSTTANERRVHQHQTRTDITYSNVMVEHGFIGLAILLGFIATLWYYSYRLSSEWRVIAQAFIIGYFVAAAFTAFLISGFAVHFLSFMLALLYSDLKVHKKIDNINTREVLET